MFAKETNAEANYLSRVISVLSGIERSSRTCAFYMGNIILCELFSNKKYDF